MLLAASIPHAIILLTSTTLAAPLHQYSPLKARDVLEDHETQTVGRYVFTILSLLFLILMGLLFGKRIEQLKISSRNDFQPVRVLVSAVYIVGIAMVLGLNIMLQAQGLHSPQGCFVGIVSCLLGYLASKLLVYLFLVERLRALNYRTPRTRDRAWLVNISVLLIGFGSIAGTAFTYSFSTYSPDTNSCSIGLSRGTLISLLSYDMLVNIGLTARFVDVLLKTLQFRYGNTAAAENEHSLTRHLTLLAQLHHDAPANPGGAGDARGVVDAKSTHNIENLLKKTLLGLVMSLFPTVLNLAILIQLEGHEPGWLCFTLCLADVTFQVCTLHYMTSTPLDLASKIRVSGPASRQQSPYERKKVSDRDILPPAYNPTDPLMSARL